MKRDLFDELLLGFIIGTILATATVLNITIIIPVILLHGLEAMVYPLQKRYVQLRQQKLKK